MYLPGGLPLETLQTRYGFSPTPEWLQLLQRASVRFPNGSGSFVSSQGLVFTNHHIALDCVEKLSSEEENLVENGFVATSQAEEKKCPDMELNVLQTISDATEKVESFVAPEMAPSEASRARRAAMNTLESAESESTGLECQVVTLWHGARYHLYCYKRYTDVRLVFVPELDAARFGGDPDNFEFPRFNLDATLFRAYEQGSPVTPEAHFSWRTEPLEDGELVFVTGHPGRTERQNTVATIEFLRDTFYPNLLNILRRLEIALQQFSFEGPEQARTADKRLFGVQNARKAYTGFLQKLQDPAFMRVKEQSEAALRARLQENSELHSRYGSGWEEIAQAEADRARIHQEWQMLERGSGFYSRLFRIARTLVRLTAEREKPNAERLREYSDANIPSLEQVLFSPAPIYESLEVATLSDSLGLLVEKLGAGNDLVKKVLAGKSPPKRAYGLVHGTKLKDVDFRRQLAERGLEAVQTSGDPMIGLALSVDPAARQLRKIAEESNERKRQAYAKLFQVIRALEGTAGYPDATFTLRVSFGSVNGYQESGQEIPYATTFRGLFQRAAEHENLRPWELPPRWLARKQQLNLALPLNFVSTHDITGGNSGSPVINRHGEIVGIIFDSNIQGLGNEFAYSDTQARAVSVSAQAVLEALRKIYDAPTLADELTRNAPQSR